MSKTGWNGLKATVSDGHGANDKLPTRNNSGAEIIGIGRQQ